MNSFKYTVLNFLFATLFFLAGLYFHNVTDIKEEKKEVIEKKLSLLDTIKKRGYLNVVLLNAPSTYYIGSNGKQGFEYDLLNSYAKSLGVELNITSVHTVKEALTYTDNKDIDIVSASLTKTPLRAKKFHFGPSYFEVQEQVVCNRKMLGTGNFPRSVEELNGLKIVVGDGTSYAETIKAIQDEGFELNVTYSSELSTEDLLQMVSAHDIDCTLADSNIYAINIRYFPEISIAFAINEREQLAWVLPKDDKELEADMYAWLNDFNQKGLLSQLKDHYYSHVMFFDYYNTKVFYKRIKSRLPKYEKHFKEASEKYGLSWTLLSAISYQESHWNPRAKSFTGVRGLMMLTQHTAKSLGVKNRLNPKQSIFGGSEYIKHMLSRIPEDIKGENRIKFALAAYNIGMGHIYDARKLAKKFGLNPSLWSDVKKTLPLLSQKRYYRYLKYGYARGSEPVKYVEYIYNYKNILEKVQEQKEKVQKEPTPKKTHPSDN